MGLWMAKYIYIYVFLYISFGCWLFWWFGCNNGWIFIQYSTNSKTAVEYSIYGIIQGGIYFRDYIYIIWKP